MSKKNLFDDMKDDLDALKEQPVKTKEETRAAMETRGVTITEDSVQSEIKEKALLANWLKAGNKLAKGQPLSHAIFGTVVYRAKVRNKTDLIVVEQETGANAFGQMQTVSGVKGTALATFKVKTSETFVMPIPKLSKPQGTRLILARCETCELRIRASNATLMLGTPLCFNDGCKDKGKPLTVETGEQRGEGGAGGGFGIGALGQDMAQVGRDTLEKHSVRKTRKGK